MMNGYASPTLLGHTQRRTQMRKYYIVEDNEPQECLDCGHSGNNHGEYEIESQDEAEVVCPECKSSNYFIKENTNA
jgi:Zn finger protein HypA/HybF involved in hydrogenase expression